MSDLILLAVLAAVIGAAARYVYREKKRGAKCIGCSLGEGGCCCSRSQTEGMGCCCDAENK